MENFLGQEYCRMLWGEVSFRLGWFSGISRYLTRGKGCTCWQSETEVSWCVMDILVLIKNWRV